MLNLMRCFCGRPHIGLEREATKTLTFMMIVIFSGGWVGCMDLLFEFSVEHASASIVFPLSAKVPSGCPSTVRFESVPFIKQGPQMFKVVVIVGETVRILE